MDWSGQSSIIEKLRVFFFLKFDTLRKFDFCYQEPNSIVVKAGLESCAGVNSDLLHHLVLMYPWKRHRSLSWLFTCYMGMVGSISCVVKIKGVFTFIVLKVLKHTRFHKC